MDGRAPTLRFGPDRRLTALSGALALAAVTATVLASDSAGRLLLAGAALVLLAYTVTDLLYWPRLTASADGLLIRTPAARGLIRWPEVETIRADTRQRAGLRSVTLEIDAGEQLVVFSRRALGADPGEVAALIAAFQPPAH
ncbi:MAG: PH domain-containing protein [Pseudonocardiales bacterium]|nr:PH domain-containing protein [Actinomycetota bacterium]